MGDYSNGAKQRPVSERESLSINKNSLDNVLPVFLPHLKFIQLENIGTTKDSRLLELELNNWGRGLVTEMTDPGDDLQVSLPLRDA